MTLSPYRFMKRNFLKVVFGAAMLTSAFVVNAKSKEKEEPFSYDESSNSQMVEPSHGIIMNPIIADLEMIGNEKVTYKETFKVQMDKNSMNKIQIYKDIALAHAEKEYKADVMVAAHFDVHASETEIEVIVTGYPAYYKNFRPATKKDRWMIKLYK